jgi:hypothetical protein
VHHPPSTTTTTTTTTTSPSPRASATGQVHRTSGLLSNAASPTTAIETPHDLFVREAGQESQPLHPRRKKVPRRLPTSAFRFDSAQDLPLFYHIAARNNRRHAFYYNDCLPFIVLDFPTSTCRPNKASPLGNSSYPQKSQCPAPKVTRSWQ